MGQNMKIHPGIGAAILLLVSVALWFAFGRTGLVVVPSAPERVLPQTTSPMSPETPLHIVGRVTRDGKPAGGSVVHLERAARFGASFRAVDAVTNQLGHFQFDNLTSGEYLVSARDGERRSAVVVVLLPGRDRTEPEHVELALLDCVLRISGRVLDTTTNEPLEGAEIRVRSAAIEKTDERGAYSLCVGEGIAKITATADGYGRVDLDVEGSGQIKRDVYLSPQAFVIGQTVSGASDLPVPDANVSISPGLVARTSPGKVM